MTREQKKFGLIILGLAAGLPVLWWVFHTPEEVQHAIGAYQSRLEAEKDSIQKLSEEIRRYPQAANYQVTWSVGDDPMVRSIRYRRSLAGQGFIGYEQDANAGFSESAYAVSDKDIFAVAAEGGGLVDFKSRVASNQRD